MLLGVGAPARVLEGGEWGAYIEPTEARLIIYMLVFW
jgi:hypothetical protein